MTATLSTHTPLAERDDWDVPGDDQSWDDLKAHVEEIAAQSGDADDTHETDLSPEELADAQARYEAALEDFTLISPAEALRIRLSITRVSLYMAARAGRASLKAVAPERFCLAAVAALPGVSEVVTARSDSDQRADKALRVSARVSARGPDGADTPSTYAPEGQLVL